MNNQLVITLFVFIIIFIVACAIGMWYIIIMSICNSQNFDFELYKKWGSPTAYGYLYNPKNQMAIIMALLQIVFSSPAELTQILRSGTDLSGLGGSCFTGILGFAVLPLSHTALLCKFASNQSLKGRM